MTACMWEQPIVVMDPLKMPFTLYFPLSFATSRWSVEKAGEEQEIVLLEFVGSKNKFRSKLMVLLLLVYWICKWEIVCLNTFANYKKSPKSLVLKKIPMYSILVSK